MTGERRIILAVAGVAAVLIAGIIGLTLGKGAAPEEADTALTTRQVFIDARKAALEEVRTDTAGDGFITGRKSGIRQGGRAGNRAGRADGAIEAQLEITEAAESAAASAQAELDSISAAPPAPSAPSPGTTPPGAPGQ